MIHRVITRVSLDSFKERSAGKKIVLLYPWTNYRNLFLSHFLASANEGLLYYRIARDMLSLQDWMTDLVHELDETTGGFGGNLSNVLTSNNPQAIAEAFAKDLATYSADHTILFIDELDRVNFDDNFVNFIATLANRLPNNVQLAFSSRLLTDTPWYELVASGKAVVLGTEYRKNDVMFTIEKTPKPQLEIYAFGRGHAIVNGQEVNNWDGALPRNLFFYFADNPLVTRDDIFDTFWPNLSVKEATNVFHVTKRKISERITDNVSDPGDYEMTQYASGFYMPSPGIVRHYDVGDFQEAVEYGTVTENEQEEEMLYRRAIDLYKAPFLETLDMPWVTERREHLKQLYAQALIGMGRIKRKQNLPEEALGFLSRALKETPEREDVHREMMELYIHLNMPQDARNQYQHLAAYLGEHLKVEPSPDIQALYKSIK